MVDDSETRDDGPPHRLPPGQQLRTTAKINHYGPVPRHRPLTWKLTIAGATATGVDRDFDTAEFGALPNTEVVGDLHCVSRWSVTGLRWGGVSAKTILALAPPAEDVTHIMAWAEYGYSTVLRLADFDHPDTLLATHLDGHPLDPERGFPLRLVVPHLYSFKGPKWLRMIEYLTERRRGFWEERGYHITADPWLEQRYSYLE